MNDFLPLSSIRRNAYKMCQQESRSDDTKRFLNQLIGINTVKKQWLDEAKTLYENASRSNGFKKVSHLQNALTSIYACEYAMKNSGIQDSEILKLKDKIENSYLNTTIEFVESYIHHEKTLIQYFQSLNSAVSLLSEYNSKLANQYKVILSRNQALYQSMQKVQSTLEQHPLELLENDFQQIRNIIKVHENSLKMAPNLKDEIIDDLRNKFDQLLIHYQKKISEEELQNPPSLFKLIRYYLDFERCFSPFSDLLSQKRYYDFIEKKKSFDNYLGFLNVEYPQLIEIYNYYNLPRRQIDKNKIILALKSTEKFLIYKDIEFLEFSNLKPSLKDLYEKFNSILSDEYKEDFVYYLKLENDLINADDNEEKISELLRFIKHLDSKINSEHNHFLHDKFVNLKNEMLDNFDHSIQNFLKKNIPQSNKLEAIRINFDFILNKLYELGNIEKIEALQNQKKQIFKVFNELEQWLSDLKNDYNMFQNLPESNLKFSLKENISNKIIMINEALPLVNLYNLQNVHDIISLLNEIQRTIENRYAPVESDKKLIILDNFSLKNYVVFKNQQIKIGRTEENDILIKCDWISSYHCTIDFKNKEIIDNNSTNGTYINNSPDRINNMPLGLIKNFNLASAFEFNVFKHQDILSFKLNKITDKELLKDASLKEVIQSMFNTEFIYLPENHALSLNKSDGSIAYDKHFSDQNHIMLSHVINEFKLSDLEANLLDENIKEEINEKIERYSFHLA